MKLIINFCTFCISQDMHIGYLNLQNIPCSHFVLRVRRLNSKVGRQVKITLLKPTFVIFLCNDLFHITRPNWHGIDLHFMENSLCPNIRINDMILTKPTFDRNSQCIGLLLFIFNFIRNFHPNCPYWLLDVALIVIICNVFSVCRWMVLLI